MANIDERLMAASNADKQDRERQKQMAYSDRLRQERMAGDDRARQEPDSNMSFRQRLAAARQALDLKQKAEEKIKSKAAAPVDMITSKLLRGAWRSMLSIVGIPFGLLYINIHVFLRFVLGEKLFCKLGQELIPKKVSAIAGEAGKLTQKSAGLLETLILLLLDLAALFIILGALGIIVMIMGWIQNPLKAIADLGWGGVSALVKLFGGLVNYLLDSILNWGYM